MLHYIGVDPGMSGGAAVVDDRGQIAKVFKFKGLTLHDLSKEFIDIKRNLPVTAAVMEKVHSMPGQGVSSTFKFGQSFGQLEMILVGLQFPYDLVTPAKWMTKMRCKTGGDKNVSKAAAQRRWPKQKITHAIADALLIADYCRMIKKGL